MNYRHAFHAGNFADVVKHAVLVALLEALKQKDSPCSYFESHAGAGRYDLTGEEAKKTGEHRDGVSRLLAATRLPAALHVYLNLVRSLGPHPTGGLAAYPGSPLIASLLLRPDDRLVLCELQEAESAALRRLFQGDKRVAIHRRGTFWRRMGTHRRSGACSSSVARVVARPAVKPAPSEVSPHPRRARAPPARASWRKYDRRVRPSRSSGPPRRRARWWAA